MNNKISSGEIFTITSGTIASMFYAFINTQILSISNNTSIISIILAIIFGIIPVLLITTISKKINTNLFSFLKEKLGPISYIINILFIIFGIYILFINSWIVIDFIISQLLIRDSYYFIALLLSITIIFTLSKGIEITSRATFILFIITMIIITFFLLSLFPYIDIENFKPIIDTNNKNILKSIIICITTTTTPLIFSLNLKEKCNDKKNYTKKIILSYIITSILMLTFIISVIGVYGIDFSKILTYPFYAMFKKVQILGFIERIENLAIIIYITAYFAITSLIIYSTKDNIINMIKIKNKKAEKIIIIFLSLITPMISINIFKKYELTNLIKITPYLLITIYIPIIIIYIRCLFIKKS